MTYAIFGSGGVGGYFGARLAAAGADVRFIARGRHLAAMREQGLQILSPLGDLMLETVQATDDPASIGPVDVVIVAVKLYDMASVAEACRALVGAETMVVSFQNGVTAVDSLSETLGDAHVIGGVTYILSFLRKPGIIAHKGEFARLVFGELDGSSSERVEAFRSDCARAGIDAVVSDDITAEIWTKFALLAPLSGMTALTRAPLGRIRGDADTWDMFRRAVSEVIAVARARGVALPDDALDETMSRIGALPDSMSSSLLHDLERGNRLELDWLSGTVVRMGREAGVATPAHDAIYTALKLHAAGGDGGRP